MATSRIRWLALTCTEECLEQWRMDFHVPREVVERVWDCRVIYGADVSALGVHICEHFHGVRDGHHLLNGLNRRRVVAGLEPHYSGDVMPADTHG